MTRLDTFTAAAVSFIATVVVYLCVIAAKRADTRDRAMLRAARAASAEAAAERVVGPKDQRPPRRPVPPQYAPPAAADVLPRRDVHASPLDPTRTPQLVEEITDYLGRCCDRHDPMTCRRVETCCGACPTLPAA